MPLSGERHHRLELEGPGRRVVKEAENEKRGVDEAKVAVKRYISGYTKLGTA